MFSRRRRLPMPLVVAGGGLAMVGLVLVLGFLLASLARILLDGGSPFGAALCMGGVVLVGLAASVVAVRGAARRLGDGSTARRALTLGGLMLLMALAPFLMIVVVVVLGLQGGP